MAELYLYKIFSMNTTIKIKTLVAFSFMLILLASCSKKIRYYKDYNYFQKITDTVKTSGYKEQKFVVNDLISVQVIAGNTRQDDAGVYNVNLGGNGGLNISYQIDADGYIEMPKIGKIKAAGFTKHELENAIKLKLTDEVKNAMVSVKYSIFKINVLGEVRKPGTINFKTDKVNILEALSEAGDLTETGDRNDILLMRQVDGKYETFKIDLRNTAFLNSPVYQIQQNDVIYVNANLNKLKSLNVNPNSQRDITTALAILSAFTLVVNTVIIIRRF